MENNPKWEQYKEENELRKEDQETLRWIMQRLRYVGSEDLSKSQIRKKRAEAAREWLRNAQDYPRWEERIDEIKNILHHAILFLSNLLL